MLKSQFDEGFGSISRCSEGWAFDSKLRWNQVYGSLGVRWQMLHSHILMSYLKCNRTSVRLWINRCERCPCYRVLHTIDHSAHMGPMVKCGVVGWITRGLLFFHRPQVFNMANSRASSLPGVMPCPCYLQDSGKTPPLTMVNSILRDLREKAI